MTKGLPIYTLPKQNAGGMQFLDFSEMTGTQMSYDCARTVRNFRMVSFLLNYFF